MSTYNKVQSTEITYDPCPLIRTDEYIFFYGGVFSQWYPSKFFLDGIWFDNAEQYMMWCKNRLFRGPYEADILIADNPSVCKSIGRKIPNFDKDLWDSLAKTFVYTGNMAKFTQNLDLLKIMMEQPGEFVECSPVDKIWGIGLPLGDKRCFDKTQWNGQNWLGKVLTDVRDSLAPIYRS